MGKQAARNISKHFVMDQWLDVLRNEPPRMVNAPILHHYTDAFGAFGIISSNSLWATATQFSNDLSEIEYAVSIASEVIEETWAGKKNLSSWEKVLVDHLVQLCRTPLHTFGQPFIVSFCEDGDLLSQWRAYGSASGFCLAFCPLVAGESVGLVAKRGFRTMVKRIIYDEDKQRERLCFLLRHLTKLVNGFSFPVDSAKGAAAHIELSLILILEMTDWACVVKHKAFSEEKEWRIITYPKGATLVGVRPEDYNGVSVRPTSKLLLPYMVLMPPGSERLPLAGIRCGPSQFQEQSGRAMNILLRSNGYKNVAVTFSRIPLRT
jgi:hypothetical protein